MAKPRLIVITGPTGVGKTDVAIGLAKQLGTEIVSADSRQIYQGIPIVTAQPTSEQLAEVHHHFIGTLPLDAYYSAAQFEEDALGIINRLFREHPFVVMCGGSMMYVDAVTRGIDNIPTISDGIRLTTQQEYREKGLGYMLHTLQQLDPKYYDIVDHNNHKRVVHAVEICRQAGKPYSDLRKGNAKSRPFEIIKVALNLPREELFDRINRRVDRMIESGLEKEAESVYPLRHLNSLNTVGLKEIFAVFDGIMQRDTTIERIKKNTRVYAKKQLTWYRRDSSIIWTTPEKALETISELINVDK